jgi:hypothetical protein
MGAIGLTPWQLWGDSKTLEAVQDTGLAVVTSSTQVAKVTYKRPETWSFWLGARLVGGDTPVANSAVLVRFSIILGAGRSSFATEQPSPLVSFNTWFQDFRFVIPAGVAPGLQNDNIKYVTSVICPPTNDSIATTVREVDHLVAEDIQCRATLYLQSIAVNNRIIAEATAYFAPWSHVRPDWFQEDPARQFIGSETGGT